MSASLGRVIMSVRSGTKDEVIGEGIETPIDMPPNENIGIWSQEDVESYSNLDETMGISEVGVLDVVVISIGLIATAYGMWHFGLLW